MVLARLEEEAIARADDLDRRTAAPVPRRPRPRVKCTLLALRREGPDGAATGPIYIAPQAWLAQYGLELPAEEQ